MLGGKRVEALLKPYSYTSTFRRSAHQLTAALWSCPVHVWCFIPEVSLSIFIVIWLEEKGRSLFFSPSSFSWSLQPDRLCCRERRVLAGRASVGALHLWNLFPWFGLSPDLRVWCRTYPFERTVAVLPRPIKGEKGSPFFFSRWLAGRFSFWWWFEGSWGLVVWLIMC